jgi:glycosyltransferase involved in cell wall biosynthesis
MEEIKISVVIPFYNAKKFVSYAVETALQQPETGEVLLIEDGSPDGGLEVCQSLAQQYPRVKLLRHEDGKNHGASKSRNLGIQSASFAYIAFLDADDFFLPDRFSKTIEVFHSSQEVDGVYEAIGTIFQNDSVKEFWSHLNFKEITTVKERIGPEELFKRLMESSIGYFHLDGFTVRKTLFDNAGYFSEKLNFYEDTDLIFRMSVKGNLFPGSIEKPVAMRRVHDLNRITYHQADKRKSFNSYNEYCWSFLEWGRKNVNRSQLRLMQHHVIDRLRQSDLFDDFRWADFIRSRYRMIGLTFNAPDLLFDRYLWRRLIPSRQIFNSRIRNNS